MRTLTELAVELREVPLLRKLTDEQRAVLIEACDEVVFPAGEEILQQGDSSQNMWIVLEGDCEVFMRPHDESRGEPIMLATLGPHTQFGEMSFFDGAPHSASVRAKSDVKLLKLTRAHFSQLSRDESPLVCALTMAVVESLAERLRRMDQWVGRLMADESPAPQTPDWDRMRHRLFDSWKL